MKRSCYGCRAADLHNCSLGYKTKTVEVAPLIYDVQPTEECPKPKTYKKYFEELDKGGKA